MLIIHFDSDAIHHRAVTGSAVGAGGRDDIPPNEGHEGLTVRDVVPQSSPRTLLESILDLTLDRKLSDPPLERRPRFSGRDRIHIVQGSD